MKHLIYSMHFKGRGAPASEQGVMKVNTSATSCLIRSVIGSDGLESAFEPAEGGMAYFESEVRIISADAFSEAGEITFGEGENSLKFTTIGQGHLKPENESKSMTGAIMWNIEGGEGQFNGATGIITSNFLLAEDGEVTDYQFGVIRLK